MRRCVHRGEDWIQTLKKFVVLLCTTAFKSQTNRRIQLWSMTECEALISSRYPWFLPTWNTLDSIVLKSGVWILLGSLRGLQCIFCSPFGLLFGVNLFHCLANAPLPFRLGVSSSAPAALSAPHLAAYNVFKNTSVQNTLDPISTPRQT